MGCGGSKNAVATAEKSQPQSMTNSSPTNALNGHSTSPYKPGEYNKIYKDGENLPPPRPPKESVEELLKDKRDLMRKMDQHANQAPFNKAIQQGINEFTGETLLPKDIITEHETLQVVENTNQNNISSETINPTSPDKNEHVENPAIQPQTTTGTADPAPLANEKENADAAELLLEKYKRDTEKAKNLMMVDKMRHNITLQDKLAKRKEMKRKAQEAAALKADLSNEDAMKQKDEETVEEGQVGIIDNIQQQEQISRTEDLSIALANISGDGEVEAAQDKYDDVMAEVAPMPTAPDTRKEAIYGDEDNIELFKDLEDFAVNMEQISSPTTTFAVLMKSLYISQLSDLEKVRILFHWITKQDLNTIMFPDNIDEDTPMGFLFAIKHGRKAYAELFSRLCSAAGLHAKVITGYLKGVGYLPDYKFTGAGDPFRGSWNGVLIDGQWRLIDTHWGARHVVEDDDAPSIKHETVYRYEEHYFLTNPDQLIITHFPDEKEWQLLLNPITLEQFQESVKVWPLHYKLKLQLASHFHGIIQAPQDGVVEIRIKTSDFARRDADFKYDFMTKQKQRSVGQFKLACFAFHYTDGEFQVFHVHCPAVGEYIFKIFGMSKKFSDDEVFTNIALYQINCEKLKSKGKRTPNDCSNVQASELSAPFPEVNMPWGPPRGVWAMDIAPVSHGGPIITCDKNGEATLVMQILTNKNLNFLQHMYVEDGKIDSTKQALNEHAVHFTTVVNGSRRIVAFCIRSPKEGNYSLNLYLNTEIEGNFVGFCNYLVVSPSQPKPSPPFPSVPNGALGPNTEICRNLGIFPRALNDYVKPSASKFLLTSGGSWIQTNDKGMSLVTFTHATPITAIAELIGARSITDDLSRNVLIESTGKKTSVVIHPPKYSHESPECALKIYAAPITQTSGIPIVFTAFIQTAKNSAKFLPQSPARKWGPGSSQLNTEISLVSIMNSEPQWTIENEEADPAPCRTYRGGKDILFKFSTKKFLLLKPVLSFVQQNGSLAEVSDSFTIISGLTSTDVAVSVRISKPGDYSFSLYGAECGDQSGRLMPLYHSLVSAIAPSSSSTPFPIAYPLWSSSVSQLHNPTNKDLKRNTVNKISISLAKYTNSSVQSYPGVFLLTDQSSTVPPSKTDASDCLYEWDYVPGPGEKIVSIVVQKTAEDSSLTYALQFGVSG